MHPVMALTSREKQRRWRERQAANKVRVGELEAEVAKLRKQLEIARLAQKLAGMMQRTEARRDA